MRFYTVHLPGHLPGGEARTENTALGHAVLVREGFNWLAFFFAPFWAVAEGLWLTAVLLIAALAALIVVPTALGLGPLLPVVLGLGYGVLAGLSANDWRRAGLAARGYRLVEVVAAPGLARALMRYAEAAGPGSRPASQALARPVAPAAAGARGTLDLDPSPGFWS